MSSLLQDNILIQDWSANHGLPPFDKITPSLFEPALTYGMEQQLAELLTIVNNSESPTFQNTVAAFDKCGSLLKKVSHTFSNLCSSNGVPELQAVELKMAAPLAEHRSKVATFPGLFPRIDTIYNNRNNLGLSPVEVRLVERFHLDFVRQGAKFDAEKQARYSAIMKELAGLETKFTQNVMADEAEIFIELKEEDLAGLPSDLVGAMKQAAKERSKEGAIVTLSRSLVEPFLTFSSSRSLREQVWRLWTCRGELSKDRQNLSIAKRILTLRVEQAAMHGYDNYAQYATADTMAGTPQRVQALLEEVWSKGKVSVGKERLALEAYCRETSQAIDTIQPWDWRYYAEKVRVASYNLDNSEVKPYFPLDNMVTAIFDVAYNLFKLKFVQKDWVAYHPDVKVYEVFEETPSGDKLMAVFLHDNYARPHKRSGAWMSNFRVQDNKHGTRVIPIVINNNNFNKPDADGVCLLSFDDARTLFHEFGHGLHGMLSDVPFTRLAGTSVLRDFVELPSQLYEHWLGENDVLKKHAKHYVTGEVIPDDLLERLKAARNFNQGFQTIEYTASALLDTSLHQIVDVEGLDLGKWEKEECDRIGMPQGIILRHRLPHFQHLFSSSAYAAAYYVYLWAEVLDADAFDAFKETGNCFDAKTAERARTFIYSAGNSKDPAELFKQFRGRDPMIEPMLKKKGLIE